MRLTGNATTDSEERGKKKYKQNKGSAQQTLYFF